MANKKDFGERNKNLSEKLYQEKTYYDWSITTAFYSSILEGVANGAMSFLGTSALTGKTSGLVGDVVKKASGSK